MSIAKTIVGCTVASTLTLLVMQSPSRAHNNYVTAFNTKYPSTATTLVARMASVTGSNCNVCHSPADTGDPGTCYKEDLAARLRQGFNIAQALDQVAFLDSDGDGTPNEVEILRARTDLPGQIGYHPGLIGPTGTGPCNPSTTAAVTNQLETPPAVCYPNCDGIGGLTANDFVCFLSQYSAGASYANCDGVGGLTANDFVCFLTAYNVGCS